VAPAAPVVSAATVAPAAPVVSAATVAPVSPETPSSALAATPDFRGAQAETSEKRGEAPEKSSLAVPAVRVPIPVTLAQLRDAWPEILEVVQKAKRTAWMVIYTATPRILDGDVLTLSFPSETDVANFKERPTSGDSVSETLRTAINTVLGIRVKYVARVDAAAATTNPPPTPAVVSAGWNVAAIPGADEQPAEDVQPADVQPAEDVPPADEPEPEFVPPAEEPVPTVEASTAPRSARRPAPEPTTPRRGQPQASARYGEAVVRELLGASFIEEQNLAPRDHPATIGPSTGNEE